jgi:GT2 family glycosyltransferase
LEDPRYLNESPKLAEQLRQLQSERNVLRAVIHDYRVVERSKFARLRAVWCSFMELFAESSARVVLPLPLEEINAVSGGTNARPTPPLAPGEDPYQRWLETHSPSEIDFDAMREAARRLARPPLISVIMPVYDAPEQYLRAAIDSVRDQVYPHWELCIADDNSSNRRLCELLAEYAAKDSRIKVVYRQENGHISRASNSALALATGEFVGFLDHDDVLTRDALYEVAMVVYRHPDTDMVYSDEDKIHDDGRLSDPFFKPDWCPDSFLSRMYTCHFGVYRRSLVEAVGRLRPDFDGSQDYDLVLRLTEHTTRIHHIPKVLYHWRAHLASTAHGTSAKPYSVVTAERALNDALIRRGEPGVASSLPDCPGTYVVRYQIKLPDLVSVIVPTRDHGEEVDRCLTSLFAKASYQNFEVLLLDNGTTDPGSLATFEKWANKDARVRVIRYDGPFNFSRINNYAAAQSGGSYLLFLNNDTEVIASDWMEAMVEYAQRSSIGAVGALLLYPDGSIQHAGVITGIGGVAGHSHKYFPGDSLGYFSTLRAVNNYSAVTGACMMVRRSVFEEAGGFDETLSVAFNDVDFCLKLQAAGYRNVYLPHAKLYHYESKSRGHETTPEQRERFGGEIRTMIERWKTNVEPDQCYSPNLTLEHENFAIRL